MAIFTKMRGPLRQVVIYPGEDNFWVAQCPSLPGCLSPGETREQAVANSKEAIDIYINTLKKDGLPSAQNTASYQIDKKIPARSPAFLISALTLASENDGACPGSGDTC
jgi:predicted RNase H-like HicB family nuclease